MDKTLIEGNNFEIKGNLIYYSSTKSKRVTRNVLASKIYSIVGGIDIVVVINIILGIIIKQLDLL